MSEFSVGTSVVGHFGKATEVWDRQESTPSEEERANLLDQLHERQRGSGKEEAKSLLHRLIFLAKISPDLADKRDLAQYWEELFVRLQRYYYQAEITGLLLLYPTYVVHILESSSEVFYSVLRDLKDTEQQQRVLVLDAKILIISHNLPSRLFPQWNYIVLSVPERHMDYDEPQRPHGESVEALISECLTALLKLGKHLLKDPKSLKNLPDAILEKVPDLIVPPDIIHQLLACEELLSPAQYLDLFDAPLNILMDSDTTWPLQERLKSHLEWAVLKRPCSIW